MADNNFDSEEDMWCSVHKRNRNLKGICSTCKREEEERTDPRTAEAKRVREWERTYKLAELKRFKLAKEAEIDSEAGDKISKLAEEVLKRNQERRRQREAARNAQAEDGARQETQTEDGVRQEANDVPPKTQSAPSTPQPPPPVQPDVAEHPIIRQLLDLMESTQTSVAQLTQNNVHLTRELKEMGTRQAQEMEFIRERQAQEMEFIKETAQETREVARQMAALQRAQQRAQQRDQQRDEKGRYLPKPKTSVSDSVVVAVPASEKEGSKDDEEVDVVDQEESSTVSSVPSSASVTEAEVDRELARLNLEL